MIGDLTFVPVGTGNGKVKGMKQFSEAAHADASDPDKMYMTRMIKIYFVHRVPLSYFG